MHATVAPPQPTIPRTHAVVIGGSMAGLLAARGLADCFELVTLVERNRLPSTPEHRPGVPQSRHVHVLLTQGQQLLEQLFPGLCNQLITAGARPFDWVADWLWLGTGGWQPRYHSGLTGYGCSRLLLEWLVRQRLKDFNNVQLWEGYEVEELLNCAEQSRITGVRLRRCSSPVEHQQTLNAELVVDASGRNSLLPQWLVALGYPPVQETIVRSFLGYASRWYQRPANFQRDWQGAMIAPSPPTNARGGVLYPVEGDRWVVTLAGVGGDYPPVDEAGFLEFARSLRHPILSEVLQQAQPLSPIYRHRRTENCLRHYDKLAQFPEGLVVLGDAVCAFNPFYGQGMSVAALEAVILAQCLQARSRQSSQHLHTISRQFQQQLARQIATPWTMATGEDLRWETTVGGQLDWKTRLWQRYMDKLMEVTPEDAEAFGAFVQVMHLLAPPTILLQPQIAFKVLIRAVRGHQPTTSEIVDQTPPKPK